MSSPPHQLSRRAAQFVSLVERLQTMWHARSKDAECYLVLNEFPIPSARRRTSSAESATDSSSVAPRCRRGDDNFLRYAQIGFHGDWFYLELPDAILSPTEGQRLIQERPGFFYLKDRPESPSAFSADSWARLVQEWNPVHKCYRAGDKMGAATDLAYVWFTLWNVPVDWAFQAKLAYFGGGAAEIFMLA